MVGFKPLIIHLLITGLFIVALISFGVTIATLNSADHSIADDPSINALSTSLNSSLGQAYSTYNDSDAALTNSPVTLTSDIFTFDAIGGIWKTLRSVPTAVFNSISSFAANHLGSQITAIVFSVLGAIMIIIIFFAVVEWVSLRRSS